MSAEPTRQTIEKEGFVDRLSYPSALDTHPTVTVLRPSVGPPSQVLMAAGRHLVPRNRERSATNRHLLTR